MQERYAVIRNGERAGFSMQRVRKGPLRGKTIISLRLDNGKWMHFAFLSKKKEVLFFKKFAAENQPQHLEKIREAVAEVLRDKEKARELYQNSYLDERSDPNQLVLMLFWTAHMQMQYGTGKYMTATRRAIANSLAAVA